MEHGQRTPDQRLRSTLAFTILPSATAGLGGRRCSLVPRPAGTLLPGPLARGATDAAHARVWLGPLLGLGAGLAAFAVCARRYVTHFGGAVFVGAPARPQDGEQGSFGWSHPLRKGSTAVRHGSSAAAGGEHAVLRWRLHGGRKSVCIADYLDSATARGDRVVCVDPDGASMRYFHRAGDFILNPFDSRSQVGASSTKSVRASTASSTRSA
jgi:hypothetical protein